jgi:hypothetical protein
VASWRLLLLALLAQAALGGEMHAPHHVVLTPMVRVLAHLLGLLVAVLQGNLLPHLALLLPVLIALVLLVPGLLVIVESVFEMLVHLEMPFESIELGGHGNNLLVVWGFGTPLSLLPEPIILAHGGGHQGLMRILGTPRTVSLCCMMWNFLRATCVRMRKLGHRPGGYAKCR